MLLSSLCDAPVGAVLHMLQESISRTSSSREAACLLLALPGRASRGQYFHTGSQAGPTGVLAAAATSEVPLGRRGKEGLGAPTCMQGDLPCIPASQRDVSAAIPDQEHLVQVT